MKIIHSQENFGRTHIYAIVAQSDCGRFVVKIGISNDPFQRYAGLLVGMPHESVMLHAHVGDQKKAARLERKLHKQFKPRNTRGEWFAFDLDSKKEFHEVTKLLYSLVTGRILEWDKITPRCASLYMSEQSRRKQRFKKF